MKYFKEIQLKNGASCIIRSGDKSDGAEVLRVFNDTHAETDFLLTYPEENTLTIEEEEKFLAEKADSINEIELVAVVNDKIAGSAGIEAIGRRYKVKHRADFGISILKEYWGLGIGSALMEGCIFCAREAGYKQLELEVVADNFGAISLYKKYGFVEYGRNPKGFFSRDHGYQELVYMRLDFGGAESCGLF